MTPNETYTSSSLQELPGIGDTVYVDRLNDAGEVEEHVDNGQLAKNPADAGDIWIAAESGSRAAGHPVYNITSVSRGTVDRTRFILETSHGPKYLLRTGKED